MIWQVKPNLLGALTKKVKCRKEIVGVVPPNGITSQKTSKPRFTKENSSFHTGHSLLQNNPHPHLPHKKTIYRLPKRKSQPPSHNSC